MGRGALQNHTPQGNQTGYKSSVGWSWPQLDLEPRTIIHIAHLPCPSPVYNTIFVLYTLCLFVFHLVLSPLSSMQLSF